VKRLIVAAALSVLIVVGVFAYNTATHTKPDQPTPNQPTATPSDPLAWYKRLPPAPSSCPTKVDPGLEPFYPCLGRQPK
jgi:hypothetical protein